MLKRGAQNIFGWFLTNVLKVLAILKRLQKVSRVGANSLEGGGDAKRFSNVVAPLLLVINDQSLSW